MDPTIVWMRRVIDRMLTDSLILKIMPVGVIAGMHNIYAHITYIFASFTTSLSQHYSSICYLSLLFRGPPMSYVEGSILPIQWTAQHGKLTLYMCGFVYMFFHFLCSMSTPFSDF